MLVTVTQTTPNPPIQVLGSSIFLRVWYSNNFVAGDGVTPVEGGNGQTGFYYDVPCSKNTSDNVVIEAFEVQATTESNPTANFFGQLYVNGAPNRMIFGGASGWQMPTTYGATITYGELATYNLAKRLLYAPNTYFTADQTILTIEQIAGAFAYAAVGINGIGQPDVAPASASSPIFVGVNSPLVAQFNAGKYTAAVQTVPTPTTAPTVSTPTITLGTFGTQPGNGSFTDASRYQVAITYNGRTGESTIGTAVQFTATQGQGLGVAPNAPSSTLAASANIYIKNLDGDNTWRRASDVSGAVENNNCGFGDNNSAIGGMAVAYNIAGATPPGVSTATKPDGSTALGETPSVAPTLMKLTSLLSTMGTLYFSYSWITENGETALSPISTGVTAPSALIGAWVPLYVTETPPPGACSIRIYAGTSATTAAMKLQAENPIWWARHPIHSFNSSGAAHTASTPTSTISRLQLAYNAALTAGGGLVVLPSAVETTNVPLIFGARTPVGVFKAGIQILGYGANEQSAGTPYGLTKINYTGTKTGATGVVNAASGLIIDNVEFGDPNSRVKYGMALSGFDSSEGYNNKLANVTIRANEAGSFGLVGKANGCSSGSHGTSDCVFDRVSIFADLWGVDFSGNQNVFQQFTHLQCTLANSASVANSGMVRAAVGNLGINAIEGSTTGRHYFYLTNEYLDPFTSAAAGVRATDIYDESADRRAFVYASPLDISGSGFAFGTVYLNNQTLGQIYGFLFENPGRGSVDFLLPNFGPDVYNFSNSVEGSMTFGISPGIFNTLPNWGSRTSTAYTDPQVTIGTGAYRLINASGNSSTVSTNAAGDIVLTPFSGAALRSSSLLASGSLGVGYATGAGSATTQLTNKSTAVTLNTPTGAITTSNAALGAGAEVSFVVNNSAVAATDVPVVAIKSGGTLGAYAAQVSAVGAGSFTITISNLTAGSLSEAVVISFCVIKGVAS